VFSLHLFQRLSEGTGWEQALTRYVKNNWRRTTRSIGGYWQGDFTIAGISSYRLQQLYSTMIGKRVQEWSYGDVQWEGQVVDLQMTLNGVTHQQTLDAELWHNRVKMQYTYPRVDDIQQGNLAYVSPAGNDGFQDDAQDFSEWETAAPGTAGWEITVTNNDSTTAQAYLGDAFATGAPDDSIYVYEDVELTTRGWNGDVAAKVPISYEISNVTLAGTQQETSWAEQEDSIDIYGESEYIDVMADECYAAAAEAARDKRLSANAYPRSIPTGGLSNNEARSGGNQLAVSCAGYVFSINRRFYELNTEPLDISVQIETLVAASELVTAGSILENTDLQVPLTGADITTLIWDNIEGFINMSDSSDNRYRGGVGNGQLFEYDLAATDVLYQWNDGRLEYANGQPVPATLIRPDIIVRLDAPLTIAPPSANDWNTGFQAYIQEVEFIAPRSYRLIPEEGDVLEGSF
jgi:hypothetical protein